MDPTTREAMSNPESWKKGAVMLLFFLLLAVITPLLILVSLVGWVFLLVQGQVPDSIRSFGRSLAAWYGQTARYLTGDARRRPFPFEDLDCVTDELLSPRPTYRATPARRTSRASADYGQTEAAATDQAGEDLGRFPRAGEEETATTKPAVNRASSESVGKKKASRKKAGRKKAAGKKSRKKKVASQAADAPVTSAGDQEP